MAVPADTGVASGVLVSAIVGQFTVIDAVDELSPFADAGSLVAATVAVFDNEGQLDDVVVAETCKVRDCPVARSPKVHARLLPPVIAHPVTAGLSVHVIPPGRVSDRVAAVAVPAPLL